MNGDVVLAIRIGLKPEDALTLSDEGTFTPVGAQGGGGGPRDPTVENPFPAPYMYGI